MATKSKDDHSRALMIERLFAIKAERADMAKRDEVLKDEFDSTKALLIDALMKGNATSATTQSEQGKLHVSLALRVAPNLDSWEKFSAHIIDTGSLELLQKRVSESGCKERWQLGEQVPGISRREYWDLSLSTVKVDPV